MGLATKGSVAIDGSEKAMSSRDKYMRAKVERRRAAR
jgi:hypothetical protein